MGFETVPTASEPSCPTHCAMGTIGISDKGQWLFWKIWHDRFEPGPTVWKFLS